MDTSESHAWFSRAWNPGSGRPTHGSEVSTDGRRLAFSGTLLNELEGAPTTRICLAEIATGDLRVVSFGPNFDLSPKFSANGRHLAFRSDRQRSGNFQVYLLDLTTYETHAAPVVSQGWVETLEFSPDGSRLLLLVAEHGADVSGAQGAKTSRHLNAGPAPAWAPSVETRDSNSGRRSAWILNLSDNTLTCASPPSLNCWEVAWSGSDTMAAIVSPGGSEDEWYRAYVVRNTRVLYKSAHQLGCIASSPDGKRIAVIEAVCSDRGLCAGNLLVDTRTIPTANIDVTYVTWRDNNRLLICGIRHLETVVADVDCTTGEVSELWRSEELGSLSPVYPHAVPCSPKGFVMAVQGHRQPTQIIYGEQGSTQTIVSLGHTEANVIARQLRPVQPYRWRARDGQEIEGWLMPGDGPIVMEIHGGPVWRWTPFFLGRTGYHAMLAERGCGFFWPNPRGSAGRGQDFARAVVGDMGGADTFDCLSGLDSLVAAGLANPDKIGVMGGSYGGYMTSWLITQDTRFAAAVAISPVTNWVSHHLTCNIPHFDAFCLGSQYHDLSGTHFSRSPVMFAHRAKTPTLSICGALDRCTPAGQAREFHNALLQHGVESELVTYPHEGHGVRTFPAMIDYAARITDWFTRHLNSSIAPYA